MAGETSGGVVAGLRLSVVISSRGRPEMLLEAVRGAAALRRPPAEIVVVDQSDAPQPDLQAGRVAAQCPVRYLWRPDRGLSRARNVGIGAATGDLLAFLDDDVLPDADWVEQVTEALSPAGGVTRLAVTGLVRAGAPENPGAWAPSTTEHRSGVRIFSGRLSEDVLAGGNMAYHRAVFARVGLFDERLGVGTSLPGAEDNDFGYRVLKAGIPIEYRPAMAVTHRAWRPDQAVVRLKHGYGRGQGAFYTKHALDGDWLMLRRLAGDAVGHLRRAGSRAARGRPLEARSDIAYVLGLAAGALTWLRER